MYTQPHLQGKKPGYVKMAAAMIVLGLISCVGFYYFAQPSQDAIDENIEQLMRHMKDMDKTVHKGWEGVKKGQKRMKKSMKFLEAQLTNMPSDYKPNYKGSMAAVTKVNGDTLGSAMDSTEDLKPENVIRAVQFVKSHSAWLEKNNISLVDNMEELEYINHEFKLVVQDFGVVVTKIHAENKITKKYMTYLQNPKYQEDKMVRTIFVTVFQNQLKGLQTSLERLTKIESIMKDLTGKLQRQVSKMGSAAAKVQGTLKKTLKSWERKVSENEVIMKNTLDQITRVLDPALKIDFKEEVVPAPVLDETELACNPEKIIQREVRKKHCWRSCKWFSCSTKCREDVVVPQLKQDCESKKADFKNAQDKANLALRRQYAQKMADVKNALNQKIEQQQREKIQTLEGLYKVQNQLNLDKRKFADEVAETEELINNWAFHMVTLNGYAANVLGAADGLLYLVKQYRVKVFTQFTELKNIQNGALAPDWFKGHTQGTINFNIGMEEDELTDLQFEDIDINMDVDINQFAEFKGFEEDAGDLMFPIFVDSMLQEFNKIEADCVEALGQIQSRLKSWGRSQH